MATTKLTADNVVWMSGIIQEQEEQIRVLKRKRSCSQDEGHSSSGVQDSLNSFKESALEQEEELLHSQQSLYIQIHELQIYEEV